MKEVAMIDLNCLQDNQQPGTKGDHMKRLLRLSILCLTLWPASSGAEALMISTEAKSFANSMSFVSSLARKCDLQLQVYGASHLTQPTCETFLSQFIILRDTQPHGFDEFDRIWKALNPSTERALYFQFKRLSDQLLEDFDQVQKTMQHMKFQISTLKTGEKKSAKSPKSR
jgi:hypothetical protein